ncbi:MAG TPA: SurA N-terminal domain-containing protein [Terriglobia bacterium]|nr:SurA N-terminal domain-containing protein [Terriglobia bacterium]
MLSNSARGEMLNRIVASVGDTAITQRDVIEEYRFERFLDGKPPTGSPNAQESQAVLSRLISQTLLAEQISASGRESKNAAKSAEETLKEVRGKFPDEQAYQSALQSLGMTEQQVLKRLAMYQRTLGMINNRLRPSALPDPKDIEDYYKNTFVPAYAKEHQGAPPPLDDVREQIREILVQKKMNELLDDWLDRLKSTHRVAIYSEQFGEKRP